MIRILLAGLVLFLLTLPNISFAATFRHAGGEADVVEDLTKTCSRYGFVSGATGVMYDATATCTVSATVIRQSVWDDE